MSRHLVARRAMAAVLATLSVLAAGLSGALPAAAAPAAPSGLSPHGTTVNGQPILQWDRVRDAVRYEVEVSASTSYTPRLWSTSTYNRRSVPNVRLPGGQIHWRVRAIGATGVSPWREGTFTRDAFAGPNPQSPADGATLAPPHQPTLISWEPVDGATGYTLEVSKDPQFIDATHTRSYTTRASSYVVPDPLVATAYHWRVKASVGAGITTDWSAVRSYQLGGLAKPLLTSPADGPTTSVVDVVLDWEPVMGARVYNLQVSTDQNFNTVELVRNDITGTRFSPPTTLDNDQYYWRVSPVDSAGNTRDWADVDIWTFRRHWPNQPQLEYPAHAATVGDPFYFQWTPVRHASNYRLELSAVPDFGTIADTCTTVHTTYTPTENGDCFPKAVGTYYWRVVAIDNPGAVVSDSIGAQVNRFTYDPASVDLVSPSHGQTVEIPTLRWAATPGAAEYEVTLTQTDNGAVTSARTTGTTWTPRAKLPVGKSFRWQVQAVSASGRLGAGWLPGSQPTFSVVASTAPEAATPEATTPSDLAGHRFPTLTWTPVASATRYRIWIRREGTIGWTSINQNFSYPAGEDTGSTWLAPDTYEFRVDAYNGNTFLTQSSEPGTFEVLPVDGATGERVALGGTVADTPATTCDHELTDEPGVPLAAQQCQGLRATPVLTWDSNPNAGGYRVWLSKDQQMTNLVATYSTDQTMFIPPTALIDSQAGSAFYWWVQPCKRTGSCLAPDYADHAFNKLSKPVQLNSPVAGDEVANDVTFTWRDYLATSQDPSTPGGHTGVSSVEPDVEARQYRVQVATEPSFQQVIETAVVDQTTFTSSATTYPEGPLFWRVQAIDGSGNNLTWSDPVGFEKRSPRVTLSSPTANAPTSGSAPLRWQPLAYAASYDVEVYRNADTIGQGPNRAASGNSRQVAASFTSPLPVSDSAYTWRVRPRDAANRPGPWTDLAAPDAHFRVVGAAPGHIAPQPEDIVLGNDTLFTWTPVEGAAEYRFERRLVGATGPAEVIRTPALAWATAGTIGDGQWEWRVVSVNNAGVDMRASSWQRFVVDATRPLVAASKPAARVKRSGNLIVTFSEPVRDVNAKTFRIYAKGSRKPLSAVVTSSADRRKATLNPARNLKARGRYTLKLSGKIRDDAGNALVSYSWTVTAK